MLKINCCGQERTSLFCPDCGKKLEHPLADLHRHLDGVVKIDAAKLEMAKKDVAMQNRNPVIHKRRIARIEKNLAKWTAWFNSVGLAIGETEIPVTTKPEKKPEPVKDKIGTSFLRFAGEFERASRVHGEMIALCPTMI